MGCRMRKAQLSVQFNWIFVTIAGAIILLFFVGLVFKQKEVSDTNLIASVSEEFKAILTGAGLSTGTTNVIQIPKIEIKFACEDGDAWFGVDWERTGIRTPLPFEVIFAPDIVKGREIITWALDISAPFKILNLLHVTSPEIRYIFVGNNKFADEVFSKVPKEILKERMISADDMDGVIDKKHDKVKFIFFSTAPEYISLPSFFKDVDVSAVQIFSERIVFYKKQGLSLIAEGDVFYLDERLVYGAIFSEDLDYFKCNLQKMYKRLSFVVDIYAQRERALIDYYALNPIDPKARCKDFYWISDEKTYLDLYKERADACSLDIEKCSLLKSDIADVKSNNKVLKQKSCPLLY